MSCKELDYLFDIGNVILFFDFRLFAKAIEDECALDSAGILETLNREKDRLEAYSADQEDFLAATVDLVGYRGTREKFIQAWQEIFWLNEPMGDFIHQLHRDRHGLHLLSNTNQLHVDYFLHAFPVFDCFQGKIFSHEVGCAKPDRRIYEIATKQLGLSPERTVYVDDLAENYWAGKDFGFRAIHYTGQSTNAFSPAVMGAVKVGPAVGGRAMGLRDSQA